MPGRMDRRWRPENGGYHGVSRQPLCGRNADSGRRRLRCRPDQRLSLEDPLGHKGSSFPDGFRNHLKGVLTSRRASSTQLTHIVVLIAPLRERDGAPGWSGRVETYPERGALAEWLSVSGMEGD